MNSFNHSEFSFRSIFESAVIGIGIVNFKNEITDANPALCRLLGYSREELIGKAPASMIEQRDTVEPIPTIEELLSGNLDNIHEERCFIRKSGETFWGRLSISTVRDANGKPLYLIGMLEDIDKQKRAQAELNTSEQQFRAVFENSAIGISLIGPDRKPLALNKAILDMTGYEWEEMMQLTGRELSYPEDVDIGNQEFWDVVNGKRESYQIEKRYVRKDKTVYWARLTVSGVHGEDGKLQYLVSMTEDTTIQRLAQENLQQSEGRFKAMFDNTSVGIAMTDLDRNIIQINEAAARITGYTHDELMKINPVDLAIPSDRLIGQEALQDMIDGRTDSMTVERRYMRKDHSIFWGRVTYSLVRDQQGNPQYLIGLIEDINEQKLAAEKLASQEAEYRRSLEQRVEERTHELSESNLRLVNEIEQRQRAEDALASKAVEDAIVAERTRLARDLHDAVTQTLFSASLIAEVLPELWEMDPEEARKSNEELRQLTRGALAEMRNLLLELRPAALTQAHFPDLIKQLSEAVIGRARLPVSLSVNGDYELPPDIKVAFYRIAQESLNNIVKYARARQVAVNILLACCNVHLEIIDDGIGFDPANVKPTSLGMHIMRERAESIGATLNISSTPGLGTTVTVDWNEDKLIPISTIPTLR
jgi:PAS domain S-box-containing protein